MEGKEMGKIMAIRYLIIGGAILFFAGMAISDAHTHSIWATTFVCIGMVAVVIALVLGITLGVPKTDSGRRKS